jgi:hypothetical protein
MKRYYSLHILPFLGPEDKGLCIVQDFRELNQNSHIDEYST